jgi:Reverse transcriptase (RNA-dependent DNA polymerase)
VAGLNGLEIRLTDIGNAYLTAPVTECYYVVAGDEFGPNLKGRLLKIFRALFGLKSAGAAFRAHLASVLRDHLRFKECEADGDVYMRRALDANGNAYYEYALVFVDDVMLVSGDADAAAKELAGQYTHKVAEDPGKEPCRYLGAMILKYEFGDGTWA